MYNLIIIDDIHFDCNIYSYVGTLDDLRKKFDDYKPKKVRIIMEEKVIEWRFLFLGHELRNSHSKFSLRKVNNN